MDPPKTRSINIVNFQKFLPETAGRIVNVKLANGDG